MHLPKDCLHIQNKKLDPNVQEMQFDFDFIRSNSVILLWKLSTSQVRKISAYLKSYMSQNSIMFGPHCKRGKNYIRATKFPEPLTEFFSNL